MNLKFMILFNSHNSPQRQSLFLNHFKDRQVVRGEENSLAKSQSYNQHTFNFSKYFLLGDLHIFNSHNNHAGEDRI